MIAIECKDECNDNYTSIKNIITDNWMDDVNITSITNNNFTSIINNNFTSIINNDM